MSLTNAHLSSEVMKVATDADKMDVDSSEQVVERYPKRKRTVVNYVPSDSEEDWLSEEEEEYRAQGRKKAKTIPKKLPKHKIFPFMQLPAELRNKIYGYALSNDGDVYIGSKSKGYRRVAQRCSGNRCEPQYTARWYRVNDPEDEPVEEPRAFVPNLLAVSKVIHAEAGSFLYSQPFRLADNYALLAFLTQIGTRHIQMLRDITIMQWCGGRAHKSINFPALAMLAPATGLRRLHIDCAVGYFYQSWRSGKKHDLAHRIARKVFRDCYPFLQAYGRAQGDASAGVGLVEISETNWRDPIADVDVQMKTFQTELSRLLHT